MFDTSVVKAHSNAAPRPWGLLTLSVALHTFAVAGAVALTLTTTALPRNPPNQASLYHPETLPAVPPPAGRADAPRRSQPPAAAPRQATIPPSAITAPSEIPDQTLPVANEPGGGRATDDRNGTGSATYGSPDGVSGGVGEPDTATYVEPPAAPAAPAAPLWPRGEVHPARVLARVAPRYPEGFVPVRMHSVTVVIRCVIDKEGKVRGAEVIRSAFPPFNDAALDALHQWRFAPGSLRGEPVDTWFELTVNFQVR